MVVIRSVNDIIFSLIDFFKLTQPELDTKPGTVSRDLLIDSQANQLALLYNELSKVSTQQSLRLVIGTDLDKFAKNFGLVRNTATPSSGVALLTFSSLQGTVNINKGDIITAANGFSFAVQSGLAVSSAQSNFYKSIATKYRNDLDFVGISDQFAVEITVQATTAGVAGNIGKYSINRTNIPGVSNATNVREFSGGKNQENDTVFRNRILSVFSGSSVGTNLGYKNTALSTAGVADAFVVEPGDPLMTRDGSVVSSDSAGNLTVVSEGSGGKVDVVILGSDLEENIDSFIYRDKSNNNDPANSKNDVILGQIAGDENKTINRRRIDNLKTGVLPAQPVDSIIQVSGSLSGSNFKPKSVDSLGRVSGNFELIKDTGVYGGSAFGFDKFHWISDTVSLFEEDRIKGKFNGQDTLTFTEVSEIPVIQQNISIANENSLTLTSDRSLLQLLHTPAINVTRVFNVNTGERYTIVAQNPNGTGTLNTSGVIKITGNTLPTTSDVLQVDYSWVVSFNQYSDYDGRKLTNNLRTADDSIDWGYSNLIRSEFINFTLNGSGTFFVGNSACPISSVIDASIFDQVDGQVSLITSGTFAGRLSVQLNVLLNETQSVDHVYFKNTYIELYQTDQNDGLYINSTSVIGIDLRYNTNIILPKDTKAVIGDKVSVILNTSDVFNIVNSTGNFSATQLTIPANNLTTLATQLILKVNYVASIQEIFNIGITSLPSSRAGNGFIINNSVGFTNGNFDNTIRKDFLVVQQNLSNQYYIELNLSSLDSTITVDQVLTVIRLSDNLELWNRDNLGTIAINGSTNNYQLIFNNVNSPSIGQRVLVLYYANDLRAFQPFIFSNKLLETNFDNLQYDIVSNTFSVNIHNFTSDNNLNFQILEPNTNIVLASASDGYLLSDSPSANFGSITIDFDNILDGYGNLINILHKKIRILNSLSINNNNIYDINSYDSLTNLLTISNNYNKITKKQISIIRILDGQELWSDNGTIDLVNNQLIFPATTAATALDKVFIYYFTSNNLKQAATRLSLNISDQVNNSGVISVNGITLSKASDIIFTATSTGTRQNLLEAIRKTLGLNSNSSLPNNIRLVNLIKLEKVNTATINSDDVLSIVNSYDTTNTTIKDNTFYLSDMISDVSLGNFDFILTNSSKNSDTATRINIGDRLRATFYYITVNDLENVSFTKNGILYTNKSFALINKIYISSGFRASQSARLSLNNFNQPITGSRYKVFYDYLAPKQNERIIIRYNYNKLVSDVQFNIENTRPINADVLTRQSKQIDVDATINIVIADQFKTSTTLILQNLKDRLIAAINSTSLGTVLDSSSLINTAFSVEGITGARILYFNKTGQIGQVLSLKAQSDEFFVANTIIINVEVR